MMFEFRAVKDVKRHPSVPGITLKGDSCDKMQGFVYTMLDKRLGQHNFCSRIWPARSAETILGYDCVGKGFCLFHLSTHHELSWWSGGGESSSRTCCLG